VRNNGEINTNKITSYKSDWIQHINRMPRSRLLNSLTKYAPRDIRNHGRPLKRLLEEWDRNRPQVAYFPESDMMMVMIYSVAILYNSQFITLAVTKTKRNRCRITAPK
jgi:hypothetical protein